MGAWGGEVKVITIDPQIPYYLVGRAEKWNVLTTAFAEARRGQPSALMVVGEAGMGKTMLMKSFTERLPAAQLITATGYASEQAEPFGVVNQILASLGEKPPAEGLRSAFGAVGHLLHTLNRFQKDEPVLICVDDLHWADEPSGETLALVARRLTDGDHIMMTASTRPLKPGVQLAWQRLTQLPRYQLIELSRLGPEQVHTMASQHGVYLDPEAIQELWARAEGNPLYAATLIGELSAGRMAREDLITPKQGTDDIDEDVFAGGMASTTTETGEDAFEGMPAPATFSNVVQEAFIGLSEQAKTLIGSLTVLDGQASMPVLKKVTQSGDVSEALREVEGTVLVPERGNTEQRADTTSTDGEIIRLSHPLVIAAIAKILPSDLRTLLHHRASQVTTGTTALEHRVAAGDGSDPILAKEIALAAEEAYYRRENAIAARYYQWASELSVDPAQRERFFLHSCYAHLLALNTEAVAAQVDKVRQCADTAYRDLVLGLLSGRGSHLQESVTTLEKALGTPHALADPLVHERLVAEYAMASYYATLSFPKAIAQVDALAEMPVADLLARGRAIMARAVMQGVNGGTQVTLDAITALGIPTDPSHVPAEFVDVLTVRGVVHGDMGNIGVALADLNQASSHYRTGAPSDLLAVCHAFLADVCWVAGAWDESEQYGTLAFDVTRDADLTMVNAMASLVPSCRGDESRARGYLEAGDAAARLYPNPDPINLLLCAHVAFAETTGHLDLLESAFGAHDMKALIDRLQAFHHNRRLCQLAQGYILLDRLREAETICDSLLYDDPPDWLSMTLSRLRGQLAIKRDQLPRAETHFATGFQYAEAAMNAPFYRAQLLHDYGRLLAMTGQREMSVPLLRDAHASYASLQAWPYLAHVTEDLRAVGAPVRNRVSAREPLTSRDRQVAKLAAHGMTNREIADELYITSKAVEHHLATVFAALGASNREDLHVLLQDNSGS